MNVKRDVRLRFFFRDRRGAQGLVQLGMGMSASLDYDINRSEGEFNC